MFLTKRQKEFLSRIFEHYLKNRSPIHYTTVAEWLGVSKWTAYDMLKRLEQEGYLSSTYAVNERKIPGRSLLLYAPTSKLAQLMECEKNHFQDDWLVWKNTILSKIERLKISSGNTPCALVNELTSLLPDATGPTMYCACLIAVFVAYLKSVNEQGMKRIRQFIDMITKPEQRLSLLSGTVVGILSSDKVETVDEQKGLMANLVNKFHNYLAGIDLRQVRALAGFLDDLLQNVS